MDQPLATEKQITFIKALLEQKEVGAETKAMIEAGVAGETSRKQASNWIEWLLVQPKIPVEKKVYADPPEGMHTPAEGGIFKVYKTRNGHVVASELLRDSTGKYGFVYLGKRGLKGLSETTRMPADEAKKFGKTYGICVRCAASLTDERSIFAGYGPICADNEGWPYPKMDEAMAGLGFTEAEILPGKVSLEDMLLGDEL